MTKTETTSKLTTAQTDEPILRAATPADGAIEDCEALENAARRTSLIECGSRTSEQPTSDCAVELSLS
jgi:hypothetical protein